MQKTFIVYILFFISSVFASENITLQQSWKNQFQFAGYYMAKEKGFYKKLDLNVSIKEFENSIDVTADVMSQKSQFGVGRSSLIYDRLEGKNVVMLAAIFQHSPVVLLAKKSLEIKNLKDLKGKRLMMTSDQVGLASINSMLLSVGIRKGMYELQEHSFNVQDLIENKTDAMLAYISNEPHTLEIKNIPYISFSPKDYQLDFYSDILFTSQELLEQKPLMVADFREASLEGWKYALSHTDETIDIILQKYNTQNKTRDDLAFEAKAMVKLIDKDKVMLGSIDKKRIKQNAEVYRLMDLVKKNHSLDGLVYEKNKQTAFLEYDKNFKIATFMEDIVPIVRQRVYDFDTEQLPSVVQDILKRNPNVQALKIVESIENKEVLKFYKKKKDFVFNKKIPKHYFGYSFVKQDIVQESEKIGEITVYFLGKDDRIGLTHEEKEWIKTHNVRVGVEQWSPVVFSNTKKDIDGIAGDFTKRIVELTGLKTSVVNDTWNTILEDFKKGKIDLLPATYLTQEREQFGLYTDSYFKMRDYIYSKTKHPFYSLDTLRGKKLAIVKGYGTIPKIVEAFGDIELIYTQDLSESVNLLLRGKVDALYESGIAVEKMIHDEMITNLQGVAITDFQASSIHYFSRIDEPLLHSILQKALFALSSQEKQKIIQKWFVKPNNNFQQAKIEEIQEISFIDLLSKEEVLSLVLLFMLFSFVGYKLYKKSNILDIKIQSFNKTIVIFELSVIMFMIYEIAVLDRTENMLEKIQTEKYSKLNALGELRQSSNDLTNFIRTFVITRDKTFEKQYLDTLKIRNGKKARPQDYGAIYWDLHKDSRIRRHPAQEKISLNNLIEKENFSVLEKASLVVSQNYAKQIETLELEAFVAVKNNQKEKAIYLLYSSKYYDLKHNMMLPIDELFQTIKHNTDADVLLLNKKVKNQFRYIFVIALLFILGNILIYVLLVRKIGQPIEYLRGVMKKLQKGDENIEKKSFYNDEIGAMNKEFFSMQEIMSKRAKELDVERNFNKTLLDSQEQLIITTDGKELLSANETFFDFFAVDSTQDFMEAYDAKCICETFNTNAPEGYLQISMGRETWIDYVISRSFGTTHKAMISMGSQDFIFSVTGAKLPGDKEVKSAVFTNITEMEKAKQEIEFINKQTRESIEYASLIQGALIPDNKPFKKYFQDYFAIWHPKDTIGGDIYLFEELRHDDECLLMVIDCTGHGVPGAFVTMLVKAIERQITAKIKHSDEIVSPAKILSIFNKNMKQLLKQETIESVSNAGFDGGIIYYNKKDRIIKYAGAETPLFYVEDEELKMIKGDRYSVGYKKCDIDHVYKEHSIEIKEGMQFYLTTDGYLDQNGGEKSFPFGKKRFKAIIEEYHQENMADQQEVFLNELQDYQRNEETNDDVTLIGFRI